MEVMQLAVRTSIDLRGPAPARALVLGSSRTGTTLDVFGACVRNGIDQSIYIRNLSRGLGGSGSAR